MITKEKYIILNRLPKNKKLSAELCILNFDITDFKEAIEDLINSNPNVVFWSASNNYSKEYIKLASKLGFTNVISIPINTDIIKSFFDTQAKEFDNNIQLNYKKLKNSKILIVDDNESNIKLLRETLADLGIDIKSCMNPISALELVKREKFSLFLLDILMPAISGFELAEIIKSSSINSNTPIIFISAISGTENILNGYNLGAYSYIEKPFNINIVKSQIYNILQDEEIRLYKDKEKENFVATLTHDLKSPINAEICALNYLIQKISDKSEINCNELLTDVLSSAKYMKLITDKILSYYKQKNSVINLNKEDVSFSRLIISSIEELKYLSNEKNIKISLKTELDNDIVSVDIIEIKRVINNLLSNAIEYSRKNGVINIYLQQKDSQISCSIKDYGIGIEIDNPEKVFDEYITYSKKEKKIGFGLGLNICKKIINAHNGNISIKSKQNKGTTVTFTIPL